MGHSTMTMTRPGVLTKSQCDNEVDKMKEQDRDEHGYSESPDSWVHADKPSSKHSHKVFSSSAAQNIIDSISNYESIFLYYVPQKIWDAHFLDKTRAKKEQKLNDKISLLKKELDKHTKDGQDESGVTSWTKGEKLDTPVFVTCEHCNSRINATRYLSTGNGTPNRCPICRADNFSDFWREEIFGKKYVTKRNKLLAEIESLTEEIKKLASTVESSISLSDLDKKEFKELKNAVKTIIAADIHH